MNSVHLSAGSSSARRLRSSSKSKGRKPKGRPKASSSSTEVAAEPQLAAAGSLTRTKALLLAALRVWELKHRIGD